MVTAKPPCWCPACYGRANGVWFEAYVIKFMLSELRAGDLVIMNNLSSHEQAADMNAGSSDR